MTDGFIPWDGDYEKQFYWVRLRKTGRVIICWPNAGYMNELEGKCRQFSRGDVEEIRPIEGWPWSDDGTLKKPRPARKEPA